MTGQVRAGIESVTACQTARTLSPNLLCPNLCGALDTVHGLLSGGCGDLSAEREFPSDKVYRRDDCGIVGVEASARNVRASTSSTPSWTLGLA
jgi:hypothetical protein